MAAVFWIIGLIAALIVEASTTALVSVWFAAGALGGLVCAALGTPLWVQGLVFAVVSAVSFSAAKPVIRKLLPNSFTPTNAELSLGRTAEVIEDIDNSKGRGRVRLDGVDWAAVSENGEVIRKGESVTVTKLGTTSLTVISSASGTHADGGFSSMFNP